MALGPASSSRAAQEPSGLTKDSSASRRKVGKGSQRSKATARRQQSHVENGSAIDNGSDALMPEAMDWRAVDLPSEAAAMAGETDADFYEGLDMDGDGYMGLTELEGVQVVKDAKGGVRFISDKKEKRKGKAAGDKQQRASDGAVQHAAPKKKRKTDERGINGAEQTAETAEAPIAQTLTADEEGIDLPPVDFGSDDDYNSEEQSEERDHSDADQTSDEDGINADFALLDGAVEYADEVAAPRWSNKDLMSKLPAWKKLDLKLHPRLYTALDKLAFKAPTAIQASALPLALAAMGLVRDVVGVAQTGSGKTLAYSLPILQWIGTNTLEDRQMQLLDEVGTDGEHGTVRLAGLVLAPTRELALQVTKHIQAVIDASSAGKAHRWASVVAVTGGISEEKQRRLLLSHHGRGVDIIVATPGRLWDMCKGDDDLTRRIKASRFLVIDEADRMIETGHFAEMDHLLALVRRAEPDVAEVIRTAGVRGGASDLQTFIFSATLSKELQHNLKRNKRSNKRKLGTGSSLDDLMDRIDFRDDNPAVIDLSTKTRVASSVVEIKAECLLKDKDLYLYYFLLRYPGRTLVFVNAIDGIRRLQPLLLNLGVSVHPLHSQLQQKQRLKNLDRFRADRLATSQSSAVLLATDVAARGLDIPAVDHVVHFQLPRSTDTYVHRSGRTARAGRSGVSLALIDPSEKRLWRDLSRNLKREDSALPSMPIEYSFLPILRERLDLAREIDRRTHAQTKEAHDDAWLRKLAAEAEMDLSDDEGARKGEGKSGQGAQTKRSVAALRAQLDELLHQPLRARGISSKYLTGGSRDFLDGILADTQHDTMIGVQRSTVQSDLAKRAPQRTAPSTQTNSKRKHAG